MSTPSVPKASLYYYNRSIWASVPLLTLEEKGYGPDEVDLKEVDLSTGENFAPSYLRINNNATVPTLVVPLATTLDPDVESRYKAIKDTKAIVEFLDKSRSPLSRTHTTSSAPAPALTPATMEFAATSNRVIDLLHSEAADPNALMYVSARDDASLKQLSEVLKPMLTAKCDALDKLIEDNNEADIKVSDKTVKFWQYKRVSISLISDVVENGDKSSDELDEEGKKKREEYFKAAVSVWKSLKDTLTKLSKDITGPFVLGDQLSIADLHLAAWFARVAWLAGARAADDGNTVVAKVEGHIGDSFALPKDFSVAEARRRAGLPAVGVPATERQARLAAFWDAIKERPSWKKVYGDELH